MQNRPKGTKHNIGPSSDQSCWSVFLPTNNIAWCTCNIVGALYAPTTLHRHRAKCLQRPPCKMLLIKYIWDGQLAVGLLAVGCWQLAVGS